MDDTEFDFDTGVNVRKVAYSDGQRKDAEEMEIRTFIPDNYDTMGDDNEHTGVELTGVPDGLYMQDDECGIIIPVDDWAEHLANEHVAASSYMMSTNTPKFEF
ncbi:hypothetical protein Thermo_01694 [Thermoplasmatales archaeon]|nr:hypothetical protein Thermo_01694 [Thermoplasmatales archaeon]